MKNSVKSFDECFNENFTISWHNSWKSGKTIYQKVYTGISKISIFPRAIWYDTIYRYRTDISMFSICRSITILQTRAHVTLKQHRYTDRYIDVRCTEHINTTNTVQQQTTRRLVTLTAAAEGQLKVTGSTSGRCRSAGTYYKQLKQTANDPTDLESKLRFR